MSTQLGESAQSCGTHAPCERASSSTRATASLPILTRPLSSSCVPAALLLSPAALLLLSQLVCFTSGWALDVELPLPGDRSDATAQATALAAALAPVTEALTATVATVDGTMPSPTALVSQLAAASGGGGGTVAQPHAVCFYSTTMAPPMRPPNGGATVRLTGVVHGRCFASPKDAVDAALGALRRDLAQTLKYRVSKFFSDRDNDDDDDDSGAIATDVADSYMLPRRAHLTLGDGASFSVCDHLDDDDDASAVAQRLSDYLGLSSENAPCADLIAADGAGEKAFEALLGPEAAPSTLAVRPAVAAAPGSAAARKPAAAAAGGNSPPAAKASGGGGGMQMALAAGVVVALVGVGLALMMSSGGSGEDGGAEAAAAAAVEAAAAAASTASPSGEGAQ